MATSEQQNAFFGNTLKIAWGLVRRHVPELLILFAIQTLAYAALEAAPSIVGVELPAFLLLTPHVLISSFFLGAMIHIMLWEYRPQLQEGFSIAARAYVVLLIVSFLTELAISIGFLFLAIPGILAAIVTAQAPAIVMAERPGIQGAFQESLTRSMNYIFPIFGVFIVAGLATIPVFIVGVIIVAIIGEIIGPDAHDILITSMIGAATTTFSGIMAVSIYLSIRTGGPKLSWSPGGDAG